MLQGWSGWIACVAPSVLAFGLGLLPPGSAAAQTIQEEVAKLLASDGGANDFFGTSVAVDGNTAVVGAVDAAYVFVRSGSGWNEEQKLVPSGPVDRSVSSVAVNVDTAVVGVVLDDDQGNNAGAVYVFERTGQTWTQQAKLLPDVGDNQLFGASVSVHGDTVGVGANGGIGAAYVYVRQGPSWSRQAELNPGAIEGGDFYGRNVVVHGDKALVSAFKDDDIAINAGALYVFNRTGTTWDLETKLTASDGAQSDTFGTSIDFDGTTLIVGAEQRDAGGNGAAYFFVHPGSTWTEEAKVVASDGAPGDQFGVSVAVHGPTAVVGAHRHDEGSPDSGAAYVFVRSGTIWDEMTELASSDRSSGDLLGQRVSLDGTTALIAARADDDLGPESGSAYVFAVPAKLIDDILRDFRAWVRAGLLVPSSPGILGRVRLRALHSVLRVAGNLIDAGETDGACILLSFAHRRTDGQSPPPDFVAGPNAPLLADDIMNLMDFLGCP